jgi:hypothetical protein
MLETAVKAALGDGKVGKAAANSPREINLAVTQQDRARFHLMHQHRSRAITG